MWTKQGNTYKVVNHEGELVSAKRVANKTYGVFWETEDGQWVKKVVAVRNKLKLTGRSRKQYTGVTYSFTK